MLGIFSYDLLACYAVFNTPDHQVSWVSVRFILICEMPIAGISVYIMVTPAS